MNSYDRYIPLTVSEFKIRVIQDSYFIFVEFYQTQNVLKNQPGVLHLLHCVVQQQLIVENTNGFLPVQPFGRLATSSPLEITGFSTNI